jgi:hypothetical protein
MGMSPKDYYNALQFTEHSLSKQIHYWIEITNSPPHSTDLAQSDFVALSKIKSPP